MKHNNENSSMYERITDMIDELLACFEKLNDEEEKKPDNHTSSGKKITKLNLTNTHFK